MNRNVAIAISLVFMISAIFSVLSASEMKSHASGVCVPTMMQGTVCPENNIFSALNFHMNGFRLFFSGALSSLFTLLILFAAAFLAILFFQKTENFFSSLELIPTKASNITTKSLLRWQSLKEHSPDNL